MQQYISKYIFSKSYADDVSSTNLQPYFMQHQSLRLGFYTKVANSIKTFNEICEINHKNALIQEFGEKTSELVNCLTAAEVRVKTVRNPFFKKFETSFSNSVKLITQALDKCDKPKNASGAENCIITAVSLNFSIRLLLFNFIYFR